MKKLFMDLLHSDNQTGAMLLLTVLITAAVGGLVSTHLLLQGIQHGQTTLVQQKSQRAKSYVNACAEEALQQIADSVAFSGTGSLDFTFGACTYNVVQLTGQNREITASSNVDTLVRKIKITVDKITPDVNVSSWQEVEEF